MENKNKGEKKMDKPAERLYKLIEKVRIKLIGDGLDLQDYDGCIECLSKTVSPVVCIKIYKEFINYW